MSKTKKIRRKSTRKSTGKSVRLLKTESISETMKTNSDQSGWKTACGVGLAYLVYILFFLRYPLTHPHTLQVGDDITTIFGYKFFWIQSLLSRDVALWNPYSGFGVPFLANSVVGAFSPTNVIRLFLSPVYAFVWDAAIHFWIAAFGTYLFMRSLKSHWLAAALSGFVFAFGSSFVLNSWDTQMPLWDSAAWIPVVMACLNQSVKTGKNTWLMGAAVFLAFCYYDGFPQIVYYIFVLSGFFLLAAWLRGEVGFWRMVKMNLGLVVVFCLLGACQLLPALEFERLSNRWHWGIESVMNEVLRPIDLVAFVNPFFLGAQDHFRGRWSFETEIQYMGLIPFALFVLGAFRFNKIPKFTWMLLMALLFTTLAMGNSNAFSNAIYMLLYRWFPMFSHFRIPNRMMFITQFVMACGAGLFLDYGMTRLRERIKWNVWVPWAALLVVLFSAVDLARFDAHFVRISNQGQLTDRNQLFPEPIMQWALDDKGYHRIEPSNRVCANMYWHLFQPLTYDPTYLAGVDDYMHHWDENPDSPFSDLISMKYVFHGGIKSSSTRFKQISPQLPYFWVNQKPLPKAFMVGGYLLGNGGLAEMEQLLGQSGFDYRHVLLLTKKPHGLPNSLPQSTGKVQIVHYGNDEVLMHCRAEKPGLLFLSDSYFPGWKAYLNGKQTRILKADALFRAVVIPRAGDYDVRMSYCPTSLIWGLVLSAVGWIGILGYWIWDRRKNKIVFSGRAG